MNTIPSRHQEQTVKRKKSPLLRIVRACVQTAFFIFLPALYISAFADLKIIFDNIAGGTFDVSALLPQVIELLAVVPVTVLLGRFFCGWMCAFGAFGDFIFGLAKKVFHVRYQMDERADRVLKFVKYGLLAFAIVFLWTYNLPGLSSASPWDVFGMLLTVGAVPNLSFVLSNLMLGFIFFILIVIGSAFVQRFFCRYLCPLGAVFTILSLLKITRIVKPTRNCGNCRVCTKNCAMGIPLYQKQSVHSGECIECLQCVAACPRRNISYAIAGNDARPLVAGTLAAIAITGIYGTSSLAFAKTNDDGSATTVAETSTAPSQSEDLIPAVEGPVQAAASVAPTAAPSPSPSKTAAAKPSATSQATQGTQTGAYKDGTYTGTGMGFRGQTKVSVTVQNGKITDIVTVSTQDDQKWYQRAYSAIISRIVSSQSADVNAVSGATYSSQGIMDAVASALKKAVNA